MNRANVRRKLQNRANVRRGDSDPCGDWIGIRPGVVTARVQGLVNGNMSPLNVINGRAYNGSSAVIAAVLDGTLEVLAGEEAGAINTRNERHLGELSQERERTPELARRNPKVAKKRASERAMSKNSDNKPKAYLL